MNPSIDQARLALAMSYVPWQCWGDIYDERTALERGTAFPALDLPFCGRRGAL